jgi:hypothetical protein
MPLVSMGGTAGPLLACPTRTGVGLSAAGAAVSEQPTSKPVETTNVAINLVMANPSN